MMPLSARLGQVTVIPRLWRSVHRAPTLTVTTCLSTLVEIRQGKAHARIVTGHLFDP